MSKRIRDLSIASKYRNMPCVVCNDTWGTSGDHIKTFGSGGKCEDENLWALCTKHHLEKGNLGLASFVEKYSQLIDQLHNRGWELDGFFNKWMRRVDDE